MVPETPVASIVSAALARQSRNVPGPLSAVLVTVHVIAGRAFEPSSRRPANPWSKLATRKIEQIDNREIANAIRSAEACTQGFSFFFIFVVGGQSKSPKAGRKTDIYFAFIAKFRLACAAKSF